MKVLRNAVVPILLLTAAAACAPADSGSDPVIWSAPGFSTDFSRILVDPAGILSGGPPKDGIPAIDDPRYVGPEPASAWLADNEPVILVTVGTEARIYPLQILTWHEIVNDTLGGMPLAVTFCPLCNTGVVFERRHEGRTLDFGTTGRLMNSNLIMYDRQSESWWQQATGEGIIGDYAGNRLGFHPSLTLSFADARSAAPEADVLSRDTGFSRPYGRNPYAGYDAPENRPFLYDGSWGAERNAMDRVVVLMHGSEERIVGYDEVEAGGLLEIEIGGDAVVLFRSTGVASALDTDRIASGRDVGSVNAFLARLDGRRLRFEPAGGGLYSDAASGSRWNASGIAVSGQNAGRVLEPVVGIQHFWFSAGAFQNASGGS